MGAADEGNNAGWFEGEARGAEFRTVLAIAEALRQEFGASIDAHPGGLDAEAGVVNRSLRTAAGVVLGGVVSTGDGPAAVLTWALRQAAILRLDELGVSEEEAVTLLDLEPALGDRWPAYLALAPTSVIEELMRGGWE